MNKYFAIVTEIPNKFQRAYKACTGSEIEFAYVVTKCSSRKDADGINQFVGLNIHYHTEHSYRIYDPMEQGLCDEDSNGIIIAKYLGRLKKENFVKLDDLRDIIMKGKY